MRVLLLMNMVMIALLSPAGSGAAIAAVDWPSIIFYGSVHQSRSNDRLYAITPAGSSEAVSGVDNGRRQAVGTGRGHLSPNGIVREDGLVVRPDRSNDRRRLPQ